MRPRLALTLGDPTGIGPEVIAASIERAIELADVAVFGHAPAFTSALRARGIDAVIESVSKFEGTRRGVVTMIPTGADGRDPEEARSLHQIDALDAAIDGILAGRLDCLCTGPVSKSSVAAVLPGFRGHTEHLARRAGIDCDEVTMAFANDRLVVGLVSTHVPVRDLPGTLTARRFERTVRHVARLLRMVDPSRRPRIAVAGFNPHAGEDGLLGREEIEILAPVCESMRPLLEAEIVGPLPADTVYRDAINGRYDAVIAAYHDQAMIPLKLTGTGRTVNITMGLPFVRTSPDHGTARDIAGRGIADPAGMMMAIDWAARLSAAG